MDSEAQNPTSTSKCAFCLLLVVSLAAEAAAVLLLLLFFIDGATGFEAAPNIYLNNCNKPYYSSKYANISLINKACFMGSCLSGLCLGVVALAILAWLCKSCSSAFSPSSCSIKCYLLLLFLSICGSMLPLGYNSSYLLDMSDCLASTRTTTQFIALLLLAALALLLSFILALALLSFNTQDDPSEKIDEKSHK